MHFKHSFKNTRNFLVCIPQLRSNVLYILKHKLILTNSNLLFTGLIERRKTTQIIINVPNYVILNVFTLF